MGLFCTVRPLAWGLLAAYNFDRMAPSHAQVTKEGCIGISTRGFSVKSGAWGCSVIKKQPKSPFFGCFNTIFCQCGTIFRGDPVFYGAN